MKEVLVRMLKRLKPVALNASLMLGSVGVALLLGEMAVRIVAPQQLIQIRPDLWMPADTVGWLHRPNVSTSINTGERTVSVFTDANGFRVGSQPRPTEGAKVLLVGDSFMEALQVEYEQSAAGLLQSALPDLVGRPVSIHNAAIGGWDPDQYSLRARSLLPGNGYELVLTAVYLGNDVVSRRREHIAPREPVARNSLRWPRAISGGELVDALLRPLNDFLEVRSHLYLFFKNRLQTVRMEAGLAALTFPPQYLVSEAGAERWDVTADLLEEIAGLAAEQDAEALFVLIPAPFQVDSVDLTRYVRGFDLDPTTIDLDQPNRTLTEELETRGLRVYDALSAFRAAHESGQQLYGAVDQHFSPEGNALFANLVAPLAADLLTEHSDQPRGAGPQGER